MPINNNVKVNDDQPPPIPPPPPPVSALRAAVEALGGEAGGYSKHEKEQAAEQMLKFLGEVEKFEQGKKK